MNGKKMFGAAIACAVFVGSVGSGAFSNLAQADDSSNSTMKSDSPEQPNDMATEKTSTTSSTTTSDAYGNTRTDTVQKKKKKKKKSGGDEGGGTGRSQGADD